MKRSRLTNKECSIVRAMEVVGDRWSILLLREAYYGSKRFDEFQYYLGVAPNILSARLKKFVDLGMMTRVPLLFCGKTTLADIKTLAQLADEGLIEPPRFVPPQFNDLHALSAWMCYANFLNRLSVKRIEEDYAGLF